LQAAPLDTRAHLHNVSITSTLNDDFFICNNKMHIFVKK